MGVGGGAADVLRGAAVVETGLTTDEGALGRDSGDGKLGALPTRAPALEGAAGHTEGSPEWGLSDGSSRLGGPVTARGGSAGGEGGGDDGGDGEGECWGGDGCCCCCCCNGGGDCVCDDDA